MRLIHLSSGLPSLLRLRRCSFSSCTNDQKRCQHTSALCILRRHTAVAVVHLARMTVVHAPETPIFWTAFTLALTPMLLFFLHTYDENMSSQQMTRQAISAWKRWLYRHCCSACASLACPFGCFHSCDYSNAALPVQTIQWRCQHTQAMTILRWSWSIG